MRKTFLIAAAFSFALAGCGGGAATEEKEAKTKSSKSDDEEVVEEDSSEDAPKETKTASTSGGWKIDSGECKATKMSGDSGIMLHQTSSALNVSFAAPWVSDLGSDGKLEVDGVETEASMITEQGKDWVMVSAPNDEPGGLHDVTENAGSIKFAWVVDGEQQYSKNFNLNGSNAAMDKLRKCAGL